MLNEICKKICREQDGLSGAQLRDGVLKVLPELDEDDYNQAISEAVLAYTNRFVLGQQKISEKSKTAKSESAGSKSAGTFTTVAGTGNSANSPKQRKARITKQMQARMNWPILQGSYSVAHGVNKNYESMTAEDMAYAAASRRAKSDGMARKADWFDASREAIIENGVRVAGQLPAAVLTELQNSYPK